MNTDNVLELFLQFNASCFQCSCIAGMCSALPYRRSGLPENYHRHCSYVISCIVSGDYLDISLQVLRLASCFLRKLRVDFAAAEPLGTKFVRLSAVPPDSSCRAFSGMSPHQYLCLMQEYDCRCFAQQPASEAACRCDPRTY